MDLNKQEAQNETNRCDSKPVFFNSLNDEQLKAVDANRFVVHFKAGETIFKQGGTLTHIIYIIEGKTKVLLEGPGQTILLHILKQPDIIGGPGFNTDFRHHFSVVALEDTKACFIDINLFKRLVLSNLPFAINLIAYLNQRMIDLFDKLKNLTHKHMNGRLADALIYISEEVYQSQEFTTPLSRSDIANMSSMTNESAIRTLKKFKDDGIIDYKGNHFKILKKDVLSDISKKG